MSIGEEWMLLEFGTIVRDGVPDYTLEREALSLETGDGKTIPMATEEEYRSGNVRALLQRESPSRFHQLLSAERQPGLSHWFFAELDYPAMSYDQVELSYTRGCVGRLFFRIPGGIAYGQHWLNVKFEKTLVRVPFRILTKDEQKLLDKNYKDIRRQVQDAFKKKK